MTFDALVRGDPDEPERARARELAVMPVLRRRDIVPGEQRQADIG